MSKKYYPKKSRLPRFYVESIERVSSHTIYHLNDGYVLTDDAVYEPAPVPLINRLGRKLERAEVVPYRVLVEQMSEAPLVGRALGKFNVIQLKAIMSRNNAKIKDLRDENRYLRELIRETTDTVDVFSTGDVAVAKREY